MMKFSREERKKKLPVLENQSKLLFFFSKGFLQVAALLTFVLIFFNVTSSVACAGMDGENTGFLNKDMLQTVEQRVEGPSANLPDDPEDLKELKRKVILITLDKISLDDLLLYAGPVFSSILEESGVALMNVNTVGALGSESGYLTIGAGARLLGNWSVRRAFNRDETWEDDAVDALYRRHTGRINIPAGDVLHLYTGVLQRLNEERPYPFLIGALGESLKINGMDVAVLGNADSSSLNRQVVTIAMDKDGSVAYGDVSAVLLKEKDDFPFGYAGDALAYLNAFESLYERASLIVIEWGDTRRIDDYLDHLPSARRGELLRVSLAEFERFLLGIMPYLVEETKLVLLSPSPSNSAFNGGQRLTPVIYYDPASRQQGLLLSPSTRRPGIITNLDIAPFVLDYLGADEEPVFLFGAPFQAVYTENHLQELAAISQSTVRVYNQRPAVIKGYITAQIVLLLGGLAGLIYRFKPVKFLLPVYYALLFFPLAVLLIPSLPGFPSPSLYVNIFWLLGIVLFFTILAHLFFKDHLARLSFTGLLIFGILVCDLLGGAYLNSRSFLGYCPIGGARFYGLGNEYMGMMVGSFILGFGSLSSLIFKEKIFPGEFAQNRSVGKSSLKGYISGRKDPAGEVIAKEKSFKGQVTVLAVLLIFILLSFFILFLMASPVYGANFGGAVTAGVALAGAAAGMLTFFGQKGLTIRPGFSLAKNAGKARHAVPFLSQKFIYLFFILAAGGLLYFLNLPRPDEAVSHLGQTWELVRSDGLLELWNIVWRKLDMNFRLVRYSLWSRIMFLFIFLVIFLYYYPVGLSKKIFNKNPGFKAAIGGIIAGTITAFLTNDSGVVAAATIMLFGGLPFLLLCIHEMPGQPRSGRQLKIIE